MHLLTLLKTHQKTKLSFLFHGEQGTGKTSTIKAIANFSRRHVIVIKLSQIRNDYQLMNILHNETITNVDREALKIPLSERIYVFEDIDADTDIVFQRKNEAEKEKEKKQQITISGVMTKMDELTLSGILNALDGFLDRH